MNVLLLSVAIVLEILIQPERTSATHRLIGQPPRFASQQPNVTVFEADGDGNPMNLELACNITSASGNVDYTWYRGNNRLPQDMVDPASGRLTVANITEGEFASRQGVEYYCVANKIIGKNSYNASVRSRTITVFYASFDGFEQNVVREVPISVAVGSSVALECDVLAANPPPRIEWLRDDTTITEVPENNAVRFLDDDRYLFISNVRSDDLTSTFSCRVTNALLHQTRNAPTTYTLVGNLSESLVDYKQIGDLMAFVGDVNFEFTYVGGSMNGRTRNILFTRRVGATEKTEISNVANIARITEITEEGMFFLSADVDFGPATNVIKNGTLTVYRKPSITESPMDMREVFVGEGTQRFVCEFVGAPVPDIRWYFNGQPIAPNSGVSTFGNTLTIASPEVHNSGVYQCIISNRFGDDQRAWLLEVRQPAEAQVVPFNFTALDAFDDRELGALIVRDNGSDVTFSIDVIADPCPSISWIFNGIPLGPPNSTFSYDDPCIQVGSMSPNWRFTLQVPLLTKDTSGPYSANFTNMAGTTTLPKAYITVPDPVAITDITLSMPCLKEGKNVSVRCVVSGFPRPTIVFSFNDTPVTPGAGSFKNFIVQEFYDQVAVVNVNMSAGGRYICTATGEQVPSGQTARTEDFAFCTLPVIDSVTATSNPVVGQDFSIECRVGGTPLPNIRWQFNDGTLENGNKLRIVETTDGSTSSVEVDGATTEFSGIYTCIVSNAAGSMNRSVRIELRQSSELPLPLGGIIGIAAGGVAIILMIAFVILLLVCVYTCAKKTTGGNYSANPAYMGTDYHDGRGNVDKDSDEEDGQLEAFNPEYESLPALRPSQPPSYKPTPSYPMGVDDMEMRKVPLDSESFPGGGGYFMQDNGSAPYNRPVVDDFLSEDAQFV